MKASVSEFKTRQQSVGTEVEIRLFRLLSIVVFLLCCIVIPSNLLQQIPYQVNIVVAIFGVISLGLHLLARQGKIYPSIFYALALLMLSSIWHLNAGSDGSVTYYYFVVMIYVVFFFRGWKRILFVVMTILNVVLLMVSEIYFPQTVIPFISSSDRQIDLITGFLTSGVAGCVILWILVLTYDREQERCRKLNDTLLEVLDISMQKTAELEQSIAEVKTLRGFLPICASCKMIRDDKGLWIRVEEYISNHSEAEFSHGLCPDCYNIELEKFEEYRKSGVLG